MECALQLSECPSLFQLDPSIFESLQKERVEAGDVIYIEANSGAVKVRHRVCRRGPGAKGPLHRAQM